MAFSLRDTPIKRKLMLVILLTSSLALVLMGSTLITYELMRFRRSLVSNMSVLAQVIGSNSTASLAFQDRKSAEEMLAALSAESQVAAAAIYDDRGNVFASFPRKIPANTLPPKPGPDGHRFERAHLIMFRPILQQGERLGTIYLLADLGGMYLPHHCLQRAPSPGRRVLVPGRNRSFDESAAPRLIANPRACKGRQCRVGTSGLFRPRDQARRR